MRVRVLVVGAVADGHGALLLDVAQKGPLVVGQEVEDAVVVGDGEGDAVDALRLGGGALRLLELQAVEGGQHAELELQLVLVRDLEVPPAVPDPLGQGDGVGLALFIVSQLPHSDTERIHRRPSKAYRVLHDTVDAGVRDIGQRALFSQVMLHRVHAQVPDFVEGPAANSLGELLVPGLDGALVAGALDLGVQPCVLEHLGRAHDGEASRVAALEGGHQVQLRAGGEHLVDDLGLLLLVVDVGGAGGLEDGGQLGAVAEGEAQAAGEREQVALAAAAKVVLGARLVLAGRGQEEDVVLVGGGLGVVVEVVDDETGSLGGDVDVELQEDRVEGGRYGRRRAQGEEDVATGVDEVEDLLRRQVGTEAWSSQRVQSRGHTCARLAGEGWN